MLLHSPGAGRSVDTKVAMTLQTAHRPATVLADERVYYADLWGTTSGAARARETWHRLRIASVTLAVACALALVIYAAATVAMTS